MLEAILRWFLAASSISTLTPSKACRSYQYVRLV
jgi:hypothetical protein